MLTEPETWPSNPRPPARPVRRRVCPQCDTRKEQNVRQNIVAYWRRPESKGSGSCLLLLGIAKTRRTMHLGDKGRRPSAALGSCRCVAAAERKWQVNEFW